MDLAELRSTLQQLIKKKDVSLEYDKKIIVGINDGKQLEAEILETEDLQSNIEEEHFRYKNVLNYNNYVRIAILTTQLVNHYPHIILATIHQKQVKHQNHHSKLHRHKQNTRNKCLTFQSKPLQVPNTKYHLPLNKLLQIKYCTQSLRTFFALRKLQAGFRN